MAGSLVNAVYLDHAATTPMRPEAVAAMLPFLTERFGNPSGDHAVARAARRALDDARDSVAGHLGCEPDEVVFTGSGTEADNVAVLGAHGAVGGDVLCSAVEHHAVLLACRSLGGRTIPVDPTGVIDLDALAEALHPGVGVVSVMLVNNEVGTIQPLARVAALVRERAPGAVVHTDAVAAVPWLDVAEATPSADLVSVSAHKFGGPKGVGVLVVRRGTPLHPVLYGGAQEHGRRPGTHDVAGIVGTAAALTAAMAARSTEVPRVRALRDRLADGLVGLEGVEETGAGAGPVGSGDRRGKVAGSCHVLVGGVDQEELLLLADDAGICASAGAACASGALEPSHVLLALGLSSAEARGAVRFSLGPTTTEADVDTALAVIAKVVEQLRR
ncbi:MAG TPA: cysteine desulfurase family protein [Acidimicrobiales bacterium]|nr:cysteine desulfurase family protein [Acidimicrobiales bacterium]